MLVPKVQNPLRRRQTPGSRPTFATTFERILLPVYVVTREHSSSDGRQVNGQTMLGSGQKMGIRFFLYEALLVLPFAVTFARKPFQYIFLTIKVLTHGHFY